MREFGRKEFRISDSPYEVKLAYTGFLLLALVGYGSFLLIVMTRFGSGISGIVAHYRGSEADEIFPVTVGQLIEGLHFHAFIMALVLLVLTHIVVATSLPRRLKPGVILLAYASAVTDLGAPWLIKFASPEFAYLLVSSWIGTTIAALIMILIPIREMWWAGRSNSK